MLWPMTLAAFCSASAAMKVWAMPVGQAVTATIRAIVLLLCEAAGERRNSTPTISLGDQRPTTNDQRHSRQGDKETRRQGLRLSSFVFSSSFIVQRSAFRSP